MQLTAKELAALVNGTVEGDPHVVIYRPDRIEEGGEGSVTFLGNDKYEEYVYKTDASAILVSKGFQPKKSVRPTLIRVPQVYPAFALVMKHFDQENYWPDETSESAFIHPEARLGEDVVVGHFSIIEEGARIGNGSLIGAQVYIGHRARLGKNVKIFPGVRILHECVIGDNCIIHPNAVIGSDGFGFAKNETGRYGKIPQLGNVVLKNNVEIGACTIIDRASMGSTVIEEGVKLDNLIQVAHNVSIGENTAIAAQAGIAGSTKIGKNSQIGGQAGFAGHLHIAEGLSAGAQSGISSHIKTPNQTILGSPAISYKNYLKAYTIFRKLPELYKRIAQLEKKLNEQGTSKPGS